MFDAPPRVDWRLLAEDCSAWSRNIPQLWHGPSWPLPAVRAHSRHRSSPLSGTWCGAAKGAAANAIANGRLAQGRPEGAVLSVPSIKKAQLEAPFLDYKAVVDTTVRVSSSPLSHAVAEPKANLYTPGP